MTRASSPAAGRRRFLRTALGGAAALAVVAAPGLARAAGVEVQAVLARGQIEVGQSVYLQIEVSSEGQGISAPRFVGGVDKLDVSSRGTSSGMSVEFNNGRSVRRSTKTFTYVLIPRAAGAHELQIEVDVGAGVYKPATAPKLIAIGDGVEPEPALEHDKAGDAPTNPESEVIVWPVVDKASAYVGEQIIYELQIWEHARGNLTIAAAPTFKDFWSEDLQTKQQQRRSARQGLVGGVPYRVHETMRRALFPQKAGTLTIGGPEVQQQELRGPFFGGSGPPQTYVGRGLAIEVRPLPAAGRPKGFRPNSVGKFGISAEVDRTQLRQGEAARLSIRISGTGNIALIELPELPTFEGLRSYEPKPETPKFELGKAKLQGSRVYTMLVVADQAGSLEIPAFVLPYFDPDAGEYRVAKSKPIKLEVEANPDAAPSPEPVSEREGEQDPRSDDELLAPAIASESLVRVTPRERWLTAERWWLGSLGAPAVLGLGWLGGKLRERFGPDDDARARAQELARRRKLLNEANAAVDSGEGFYPNLAALLQAAAVQRAGPEGVGLPRERLMTMLTQRGVDDGEVTQLRELLDACDAARFGAGSGEVAQRREYLEQARALLGRRGWRRA